MATATRSQLTRSRRRLYKRARSLRLSESERTLCNLLFVERLSHARIAAVLGVTPVRVRELVESLRARADAQAARRKGGA